MRLTWDNGQGLIFGLEIAIDDYFMFDVKQSVENKSDKPVTLFPWSLVVRYGQPKAEGTYILHEGPYGVFNGSLKEFGYSDFKDNKQQKFQTTGGWLGITDKYWMATLVPDQQSKVDASIKQTGTAADPKYQIDYTSPGLTIAPGATATSTSRLFAGAKIVRVIDDYEKKYGIEKFDLTIDWGWFWFFTKPLFWLLEWLYAQIGNFGVAILILTVIVKAVFFPLANKSYAAMSKMKALQPEMEKLKQRYGEDRQRMNQELMQLYRREKVNPAAGCLPIVVQIPVFFALYKVLYTTIEMRHQPFFGWIKDLSAPDPLTILTGFGLFHWDIPQFLHFFNIGLWPMIMGVTMYLQQRLNPAPTDPVQARVFQFLPILFTFMLGSFAAGLVIYWAWSNTLSIAQQYTIMRRHGTLLGAKAKPAVAVAAGAGARRRWRWRRVQEGRQGCVQEGLMDDQDTGDARRPRSRRRASSSRGPANSSRAPPRSNRCRPSRCLKSPSPAAPMSASRAWSMRSPAGARWRACRPAPAPRGRSISSTSPAGSSWSTCRATASPRSRKSMKETWQDLASAYLRGRPTLKRVCLLIDSRHGVKDSDHETMKNLDKAAVSYQLVLTKTDRLRAADVPRAVAAAEAAIRKHGAAHPEVLPTSSETGFGIAELRAEIAAAATG